MPLRVHQGKDGVHTDPCQVHGPLAEHLPDDPALPPCLLGGKWLSPSTWRPTLECLPRFGMRSVSRSPWSVSKPVTVSGARSPRPMSHGCCQGVRGWFLLEPLRECVCGLAQLLVAAAAPGRWRAPLLPPVMTLMRPSRSVVISIGPLQSDGVSGWLCVRPCSRESLCET